MPDQINKTIHLDNSTIYSDMDEILTKPPAVIVRFGSMALLFVLLILCSIGYFVKYDEGINGVTNVQADNIIEIKSPIINTILQNNFIQNDTTLQKGSKIIVLKNTNHIDTIIAPFTGKIFCQRKLRQGEILEPGSLLFNFIIAQSLFKIKIIIAAADADKIKLGQNVKITIPGYEAPKCQIISLPYLNTITQKIIVDAYLDFGEVKFITNTNARAFIISYTKSLASVFFGL